MSCGFPDRGASAAGEGCGSRDPSAAEIGRHGESIAAHYLAMCGYRILARNRRLGPLEIDLLVERRGVVALVEVRTRRGRKHGRPEESVRRRKRRHLARAAAALAAECPALGARRPRLDLIAIERQIGGLQLRHLPGLPLRPPR
ncbi:MAG: YraN family protein [Candidatus Eisenbacteria bacterium]|nr:YraN family protein [Candidatus Eisenbacteria bacterium]